MRPKTTEAGFRVNEVSPLSCCGCKAQGLSFLVINSDLDSPNGGKEMLTSTHQQAGQRRIMLDGLRAIAAIVFLFVFAAGSAEAQTASSATVRGTVKDPTGAVIPSASVSLKSALTGAERTAQTSSEGLYVFVSISPGPYTLTVEAANFKKYVQTDLLIAPSETKGIDVSLQQNHGEPDRKLVAHRAQQP
jgi:Carboxypeptidase regulatory-like domain